MSLILRPYTPDDKESWNDFVANRSRNATFMFMRDYVDYHSDRFADNSFIVSKNGSTVALFLANRAGDILQAHGGLTYGGFVMGRKGFGGEAAVEAMWLIKDYCLSQGISHIVYKPVPHIYHSYPAEDDIYAVMACGGRLSEVSVSSTIDVTCALRPDENTRRGLRRALGAGVAVDVTDDYERFWQILTDNLALRHNVIPVHTLAEMRLLAARFPDNIRLYGAYAPGGEMLAGSVVYLTETVAHAQYISASPAGREVSALVPLMLRAIDDCKGVRRYFDFGISTEDHGRRLNTGLLRQKEGYGARATVYAAYTVDI